MKSLSWMLMGGALVAGCTTNEPEHRVTAMFATTSEGDTIALRGVALDRATYDMLVARLGAEPTDVPVRPGAPDGTVQLDLPPTSPLVATLAGDSPTLPGLTITFDDGSPQPIGLLLPAVQKVREAAMHGSGTAMPAGTLTITAEASATVAGGVYVAAGDVNGDGRDAPAHVFVVGTHAPGVSPEQRAMMADAFVAPTGFDRARLVSLDDGFALDELAIPDSSLTGVWGASKAVMNLSIDANIDGNGTSDPATDGLLIIRYAIPRATALPDAKPRGTIKVFDLDMDSLSRNGDAERAMFDAGYATFKSDAIDQAGRVLADYADAPSTSQALLLWNTGRTTDLADIITAAGAGGFGSAGYEAMACAAALPTALAVAKSLDKSVDANASAIATTLDALSEVTPVVGLAAGGELALQTYGAVAPSGDAELACAAVHQLAQLPATLGSPEGMKLRELSVELAAFDARHLDIELAAWVAAMDELAITPDDTAWAAARAKADILIEALSDASTRTQARWSLAKSLLGR